MEEINHKIILLILNQYFKNIEHINTKEDILKYYFTFVDYVQKDQYISWEEIGSNYIVPTYFELVNPIDIYIQMINLYLNIQSELNIVSPNILINPLELSSDLANEEVSKEIVNSTYVSDNGDTLYTDKAQDLFNEKFDLFYNKIIEYKI